MLLNSSQKSGISRLELDRRALSPVYFGAEIGAYGPFSLNARFLIQMVLVIWLICSNAFFLIKVYFTDKP